jgi:hypothetical protein
MVVLQVVSEGRDKLHQIPSSRINIGPCSVSLALFPRVYCWLGLLPSELLCLDRPGHSCKSPTTVFSYSRQALVLTCIKKEERNSDQVSFSLMQGIALILTVLQIVRLPNIKVCCFEAMMIRNHLLTASMSCPVELT